jgi:hypothetical protein
MPILEIAEAAREDDLECSVYTWQMSYNYNNIVLLKCKCQRKSWQLIANRNMI